MRVRQPRDHAATSAACSIINRVSKWAKESKKTSGQNQIALVGIYVPTKAGFTKVYKPLTGGGFFCAVDSGIVRATGDQDQAKNLGHAAREVCRRACFSFRAVSFPNQTIKNAKRSLVKSV